MKKKTKKILIILAIIIGIILVGYFGLNYLSVWFGFNEFTCSFVSNNKLGCSTPGASMQGDPNQKEGYLEFKISNVYNLYFKQFEAFKKILIASDNNFKDFFNINPNVCYFSGGNYRVLAGENPNERWTNEIESTIRYWQSSWDDGCYGVNGGRYELHPNVIINERFPSQLLIVKGNIKSKQYPEQNPIYKPFVTYGFCNLVTGDCKLYEPVLNDWDYQRYAEIISIEIPLKIGGYIETEINCPQDGVEKCEGTNLFKCLNYQFVSQGNVEGKCGFMQIPVPPTIPPNIPPIKICDEGTDNCNLFNLLICENNGWNDKGKVKGRCGIDCFSNQECQPIGIPALPICSDKSLIKTITTGNCNNYKCETKETTEIVKTCKISCDKEQNLCYEDTKEFKYLLIGGGVAIILIMSILIWWYIKRRKR